MPGFNIIRKVEIPKTFRNEAVKGMFDFQSNNVEEKFVGNLNFENLDWNVGLIYGASGTGKSTIGRELFGDSSFEPYKYGNGTVFDEMPKECDVKTISSVFSSVGFASVPSWLKPYSVLSNGEKMRVDLARCILDNKDIIVFDEYTSVVDRQVAKFGSFALQKAVRKMKKKFVAIACHSDIIEWLEPDWTFCTDTMTFDCLKKNDRISVSKLRNVQEIFGRTLKNIII